jgi:hypothetical protein
VDGVRRVVPAPSDSSSCSGASGPGSSISSPQPLLRQAKRRHLEVSTLSSLYLKEKALEEEFPGIGFRDAVGGREAYVAGHRVAVWEVVDVHEEAGSVAKTAGHFRC